jgi:hypothetical protein
MFRALTLIFILASVGSAEAKLCNPVKERCFGHGGSSTKPAYPSRSSGINLNPSAVPTEDAWGIETIVYDGADFSLVKGTGRIGAALSPSNSEETFFGPPGFELDPVYLQRKIDGKKYKSQKINLATAVGIVNNGSKGLRRFEVNLGVIGKYNRVSKKIGPGAGISGVAGPVTFGYSRGKDQYIIDLTPLGITDTITYKYDTETLSAGIYLNAFAFDYSKLTITDEFDQQTFITLLTGSLLLKRWIFTASQKKEDSLRDRYDFKTKTLIDQQIKTDYFGGVQFAATKVLMVGAYYNYYLLNDVAFGATLFF